MGGAGDRGKWYKRGRILSREVRPVKEGVKVINIMADGSICEDLSTYIGPDHPLPEDAKRIILNMIRAGRERQEAEV